MTFKDVIKNNLLQGFSKGMPTSAEIILTMSICFVLALYLFFAYRMLTKNAFYSKSYNISMAAISLVTCGIIIAMQSSLVISLGMVGALSIVRFRTAIKEPMDLLFLFWSIGTGIICGTGLYKIAIIVAVCVTIAILLLKLIPETRSGDILFVSASDKTIEQKITEAVRTKSTYSHIKSRNATSAGLDLVLEVKTTEPAALLAAVDAIPGVTHTSLMEHEGEFRG
ncbi:MAG: DUF4956 domain-containing protein [Lachnospiraceae bacterium]|nr:DUF4956 domain-containing protein [Lachnospiraceae bacterium]